MIEFKKDDLRNEILATDGNLLIMGGPGSGKTTIALFKAKELTANSNTIRKSQKILFLSFARATIFETSPTRFTALRSVGYTLARKRFLYWCNRSCC